MSISSTVFSLEKRNTQVSGRVLIISALALVAALLLSILPDAAYAQSNVTPNPDLNGACGLKVALILDASGSIQTANAVGTVRTAASGFVNALSNTGSSVAVVEFATTADTPVAYQQVTPATISSVFDPYFAAAGAGYLNKRYYDGRLSNFTNWESAFVQVNQLAAPDLVVFLTDGNPNTVVGGGAGNATTANAVSQARIQANITKANGGNGGAGSHIFAVGVGAVTQANFLPVTDGTASLQFVSGAPAAGQTNNFSQADYFIGQFSELQGALQNIVNALCGGTVTVTKYIDADGSLATTGDQTPAAGWTFTTNGPAPVSSSPVFTSTGADGKASFKLSFPNQATGTVTVTETPLPGYGLASAACVGAVSNGTSNLGTGSVNGIVVAGNSIVTCNFINVRQTGKLVIEKISTPITGSFSFTTTGPANSGLPGTIPMTTTAPSVKTTSTFTVPTGVYTVTEATSPDWLLSGPVCAATGSGSSGTPNAGRGVYTVGANGIVTCTFTNTQAQRSLSIVKTATPQTYNQVNQQISYSYLVTNNGNVTLSGPFTVSDNKASVSCPATASLAPGASIICTATYTITQADLDAGSVTNVASATNGSTTSPTDTETVTAVPNASLSIVKTATPTTYNQVNQQISYSYLVTNNGNVTLSGPFSVSDNKASVSCPATASLAPGASITCTASYTITQADLDAGSVTNVASATNGTTTSPTDTETVTAVPNASLSIVKTATPTDLQPGQPAIGYSYLVTNNGNVTLNGPFSVSDNKASDESARRRPASHPAPPSPAPQATRSRRPTWMPARSPTWPPPPTARRLRPPTPRR